MHSNPLVSVIIIFFNAERFLEEAIESVLTQTLQHWELLLVDDGSTDASTAIARNYETRQPGQVRYLNHTNHQNRGMGASRNLGIHQSTGKYIAFLDADDLWLPSKLEQQVAILEAERNAAMLYGATLYWHSWTNLPEDARRDFVPKLGVETNTVIEPPVLLPLYLRGKAAVPCTCSILVRRDAALDVEGFDSSFQRVNNIYEDQAFYAKVCIKFPIIVVNECWDKYRQHSGSSMAVHGKRSEQITARQFFLKWLASYLIAKKITDVEIWQALRRELWLSNHPDWATSAVRYRVVRLLKKWLLRTEERLLPSAVQRWLWLPEHIIRPDS